MMRTMRRLHHLVTALAVVLALLAGSTLLCFCAPMMAAVDADHAAQHSCCAQPIGMRAADTSCCDGAHDRTTEPWAPAAVPAVSVPAAHAIDAAADLAGPLPAPVDPPRPVRAKVPLRI